MSLTKQVIRLTYLLGYIYNGMFDGTRIFFIDINRKDLANIKDKYNELRSQFRDDDDDFNLLVMVAYDKYAHLVPIARCLVNSINTLFRGRLLDMIKFIRSKYVTADEKDEKDEKDENDEKDEKQIQEENNQEYYDRIENDVFWDIDGKIGMEDILFYYMFLKNNSDVDDTAGMTYEFNLKHIRTDHVMACIYMDLARIAIEFMSTSIEKGRIVISSRGENILVKCRPHPIIPNMYVYSAPIINDDGEEIGCKDFMLSKISPYFLSYRHMVNGTLGCTIFGIPCMNDCTEIGVPSMCGTRVIKSDSIWCGVFGIIVDTLAFYALVDNKFPHMEEIVSNTCLIPRYGDKWYREIHKNEIA